MWSYCTGTARTRQYCFVQRWLLHQINICHDLWPLTHTTTQTVLHFDLFFGISFFPSSVPSFDHFVPEPRVCIQGKISFLFMTVSANLYACFMIYGYPRIHVFLDSDLIFCLPQSTWIIFHRLQISQIVYLDTLRWSPFLFQTKRHQRSFKHFLFEISQTIYHMFFFLHCFRLFFCSLLVLLSKQNMSLSVMGSSA